MKILTTNQMKFAEGCAVDAGISELRLMTNAGNGAFKKICAVMGESLADAECVVLCGSGNNGGDGFVVARRLAERSSRVTAVLVNSLPKTACAQSMYERCKESSCEILDLDFDKPAVLTRLLSARVVVDAVFGTGFHGILPEKHRELFAIVNESEAVTFALDLPSGVNADTGETSPDTLSADYTIVFGALKRGHVLRPQSEVFGKLSVIAIGIPDKAFGLLPEALTAVDSEYAKNALPARKTASNKGDYGKLLIIAGSENMSGAAALSVLGALRTGVGLCTLASVKTVIDRTASGIYEPTYITLFANADGCISAENKPLLREKLKGFCAVCIGMGMGVCEDTREIVKSVLKNADCPVILDADGLNVIASDINILKDTKADVIITPHPGEMARLVGKTALQVNESRLETAADFAYEYGVTVVLKGKNTVVCAPDGSMFVNLTGNSGLARGGSGDILSGMIASFAAQGVDLTDAAACGVYFHGLAADRAAASSSLRGMLPSDLFKALPKVLQEAE